VLIQDTEQPYLDLTQADIQDSFNAASVRYRIAIGSNQGQKTLTFRSEALIRTNTQPKPFTANRDGFSLNAAVSLPTPPTGSSGTVVPLRDPAPSGP